MKAEEQAYNLRTTPGVSVTETIHLSAEGNRVKGALYSDNMRIVPERESFAGRSLKIRFGVDVTGLSDGDEVSGKLTLVSAGGETEIPVHVDVLEKSIETPYGQISSLEDFATYAESEPGEAFRLFKSPRFEDFIAREERPEVLRALWRGLVKPPARITAMEEFLVSAGLKKEVKISAETDHEEYYNVRESFQELITLRRSCRGSFVLFARADADFIELPKTEMTDQDFVGTAADFEYRIIAERLGSGVRRGTIFFETKDEVIPFRITASTGAESRTVPKLNTDRNSAALIDARVAYVLGRKNRETYVKDSLRVISEQYCETSRDISLLRLYQAYLEELRGHKEDAAAIFREFGGHVFGESEYEEAAAYLYLTGILGAKKGDTRETAEQVRMIAVRHPESYLAMKLLFLTNPDIGHYPRRKRRYMERAYAEGVRSPLLYAEAARDLRTSDELLRDLTEFDLQTLLFMTRNGLMTQALALRVSFLQERLKEYSELLFRILTEAYKNWPLDGILEAIVRTLMKGPAGDGRSFRWYEKAVTGGLHVIRLYEYYIETLPEHYRQILPLQIRKYFSVSDTLPENSMAVFYANIVRNRNEDPETYETLKNRMTIFAYDALTKGRSGEDYAVLYQEFADRVTALTGKTFVENAFAWNIYTDNRQSRAVIVIHDGLSEEERVPLVRGCARIHLYTDDAQILFEDRTSRRCLLGNSYTLEPLMDRRRVQSVLDSIDYDTSPEFTLYCAAEMKANRRKMDEADRYSMYLRISSSENFTEKLRNEARVRAISEVLKGTGTLAGMKVTEDGMRACASADKAGFVRILLDEDEAEKAFAIVMRYGMEGLTEDLLVRLAGRMIELRGEKPDQELIACAAQVFRSGTYDERILRFLEQHFRGSMKELLSVRTAAKSFYVSTVHIDGRILERAVSADENIPEGPEVLRDYAEHGGRRKVIRNYLAFRADAILGLDEPVHPYVAACLRRLYDADEPMDFAMKLALLKYYAQKTKAKDGLTVHEELQVDTLLLECEKRGIHFSFMQDLPESFVRQYHLKDRVFVEQKADPEDLVCVTYTFDDGTGRTEPKTEKLTPLFRGLFSREFVLFYGETLIYTVSVTHRGKRTVSAVRALGGSVTDMTGRSPGARINRMLKARADGDRERLKTEIKDYRRAQMISETLFDLEDG